MKILNRKEFLKTPANTLFSYYEPCVFRGLNIKTTDKTHYENDFVYFGLIGEFNIFDTSEFFKVCEKMENGESVPLSLEETQREGLFDDEQLFLVYEEDDIKKIIDVLSNLK